MKFTKLLTAGALVAALATVAGCKDDKQTTTTGGSQTTTTGGSQTTTTGSDSFKYVKGNGNGSTVNLSVHYVSSSYHFTPSYQGATTTTGIGGETLTKGQILPAWAEMGKNLNLNIVDNTDVNQSSTKNEWQTYLDEGFKNLDLIMTDGSNSVTASNQNMLKSIDELMEQGLLPNFKHWLDEHGGTNGSIWNSMKSDDGKVYYLPYFDGLDNLEKMWLMNQDYIEKLLDTDDSTGLDTTAAKTSNFVAQVPSMSNEKVKVSKDGTVSEVTVNYASNENIITVQNGLTTKNGKTYVEALRNYIDNVYGDYIGEGKLYASRSEIFTSEAACYNADELIALMRCMVNNPKYLTNNAYEYVYAFVPRTGEGNRLKQLMEFTNIWGQRGVSSESARLYFDKDGNLQDARTEMSAYDNLDKLMELYNEGFFPANFYTGNGDVKTEWRSAYMKTGQVFSLYDYNATSTAFNADSMGTDNSKSNLVPMLPPVVQWDDGDSGENNYFHFSEDNRALKSGGWAIPASSDNIAGACALADYLWMPEGADIQDYGPNNTYYRAAVTQYDENAQFSPLHTADSEGALGTYYSGALSLRPIITIGTNIKLENGDGTINNPWKLVK